MSVKDGDIYTLNVGDRKAFKVSVVVSFSARQKGLSGNPGLPSGTGLLFIFDTLSYQTMWMPDMKFPLDIVWLDENMTIVNITYNTPPCVSRDDCISYPSIYLVKYAIEMTAGEANKYGFRVGSSVTVQ
uniref:DUF192 domain-containing protein n=1 Tax=viral metagenome TaxID=1070528 RepID=A0A6C0JY77_9ZZZZ